MAANALGARGPVRVPEWAFVLYAVAGSPVWHQRLVLGHALDTAPSSAAAGSWGALPATVRRSDLRQRYILTPDGDVYAEDYTDERDDDDIAAVRLSDSYWPPPGGIDKKTAYRFRSMPSESKRRKAMADALQQANGEHRKLVGSVPEVGAFVPLETLPPLAAAPVGPAGPTGALDGSVAGDDLTPREIAPRGSIGEKYEPPSAVPINAPPGLAALHPPDGATLAPRNPDEKVWVHVEETEHHKRGEILNTAVMLHYRQDELALYVEGGYDIVVRLMPRREVVEWSEKGVEDARVLPVVRKGGTRVKRAWRDVVELLKVEEFADWPIAGPRTTMWVADFLNRRGGGPLDHHRWWLANSGLSKSAWGVSEHELALRVLESACGYDALDIVNLASIEALVRRLQLIEYAYQIEESNLYGGGGKGGNNGGGNGGGKGKGGGRSVARAGLLEEQAVFQGTHRDLSGACVSPLLLDYVAKEVERDASVMKSVRKAREERRAAAGGAAAKEE